MDTNIEKIKQLIGKDTHSYGSPVTRWLDPILTSVHEKGLTFKFHIRNEMTNPSGKLHGGISALIIDDVIGITMIAFNENYICITVNNSIDYKGSADEGDTIFAETSILDNENRLINIQCEIWNNDKTKLIAKGVSRLLKKQK